MQISFILLLVISIGIFVIGFWIGRIITERKIEETIKEERKDAIMKSRAVIGGQFSENLAPYLPNFPFNPTECRFVGKPVDFIVFKGMDEKKIEEIAFVEVKSGKASLNQQERNLKEAIEKKKIRFVEYRIPEELTDKRDIEDKIKDFVGKE